MTRPAPGWRWLLEHRASASCQRDEGGALTVQELRRERDETLTAQVLEIAVPAVAAALWLEVTGVGHAEGADERQGAHLGPSQRDGLRTDSHELSLGAARQRELLRQGVARVVGDACAWASRPAGTAASRHLPTGRCGPARMVKHGANVAVARHGRPYSSMRRVRSARTVSRVASCRSR